MEKVSPEFENYLRNLNYSVDGISRPMFTARRIEKTHTYYICIPCRKLLNKTLQSGKITENNIKQHIQTRSHEYNTILNPPKDSFDIEQFLRKVVPPSDNPKLSSAQNAVLKMLERNKIPYVGGEYLVVFEDSIYCTLCKKTAKNKNPIKHLLKEGHTRKYLNKFFPSVMKFVNRMEQKLVKGKFGFLSGRKMRVNLMEEAAAAVYARFGAKMPKFKAGVFRRGAAKIGGLMDKEEHFNEQQFPDIENLFSEDLLKTKMLENIMKIFPERQRQPIEPAPKRIKLEEQREAPKPCFSHEIPSNHPEDAELQALTDEDLKILLEKFDSIKPEDQNKLTGFIRRSGQKKFENLQKVLNLKGCARLAEALG